MRAPSLLFVLATFSYLASAPANVDAADSLRVMTFNIRFDNPKDGPDAWPLRKDKVAGMVRLYDADVIGMQEALRTQIDVLAKLLPDHDWIGVGRQDGKDAGEFTPIFYRRERLEIVDKNTFWLSPTPEKTGSRGWDAALPRIATWARFRDKLAGGEFYLFNTHFDHVGLTARLESAKLLRTKAVETAGDQPVVVIGDFNCTSSSPPYLWLVGKEPPPPVPADSAEAVPDKVVPDTSVLPAKDALADAMLHSRHPHHGPTTTWNGFKTLVPGRKIDHIFIHGPISIEQHAILADHWDGRFPSDHLPVLAEIVLGKN
jgi:endonuclease/exonuclease/phosphatase family metal-dependent hydrolase